MPLKPDLPFHELMNRYFRDLENRAERGRGLVDPAPILEEIEVMPDECPGLINRNRRSEVRNTRRYGARIVMEWIKDRRMNTCRISI